MIQSWPLNAEQYLIGLGDFGVAKNLVLYLFRIANKKPALGEVVIGVVKVATGGLPLTP